MPSFEPCFTPFKASIDAYTVPARFTFPFCYQPDPLSALAAQELQDFLVSKPDWQHDFGSENDKADGGKMFGVLVVKNNQGELGYLSAFSGKIGDKNLIEGFVPPVFDMLKSDGFFLNEGIEINELNAEIKELEANPEFNTLALQLDSIAKAADLAIESHRNMMIESRALRKAQRAEGKASLQPEQLEQLILDLGKQSVSEKNQLKTLKQQKELEISKVQAKLDELSTQLHQLKEKRKSLSNALQKKLFSQYQFLNKSGEHKSLLDIFADTANPIPPAGSGECAAPKLLHYAFEHKLEPICMAEFWWGASPKSEIRKHKHYYPACQSKCHPILGHMLAGMELDDNPLLQNQASNKEIEILYQDEAMVIVNKPSGLLSVPGKHISDSAFTRLQALYPDAEGPFVIHRLDMATSGLLVFALTRRANKSLQKQFISRTVKKRYVAIIEGALASDEGDISLPLRGDINDRPRQLVCHKHGKPAHTRWQVIESKDNRTKLYLYPVTGRTHQLRVHCAHIEGLNMPIVGDDLYGTHADRLHLHAETLEILHPYSKQPMRVQVDAPFKLD